MQVKAFPWNSSFFVFQYAGMKITRLKSPEDKFYGDFFELYKEAFPDFERRTSVQQAKALASDDFNLEAFEDANGNFAGFIAYWNFPESVFIEHFAVIEKFRACGIGSKILGGFLEKHLKPCIIEIEIPEDEISRRRLRFYENFGFIKSAFRIFPIYGKCGGKELLIMSRPSAISEAEFKKFYANYLSSV